MVYDAVGTRSSLPREKEEDVKGQQKLTERDKEIVGSFPLTDSVERRRRPFTRRQDGN